MGLLDFDGTGGGGRLPPEGGEGAKPLCEALTAARRPVVEAARWMVGTEPREWPEGEMKERLFVVEGRTDGGKGVPPTFEDRGEAAEGGDRAVEVLGELTALPGFDPDERLVLGELIGEEDVESNDDMEEVPPPCPNERGESKAWWSMASGRRELIPVRPEPSGSPSSLSLSLSRVPMDRGDGVWPSISLRGERSILLRLPASLNESVQLLFRVWPFFLVSFAAVDPAAVSLKIFSGRPLAFSFRSFLSLP